MNIRAFVVLLAFTVCQGQSAPSPGLSAASKKWTPELLFKAKQVIDVHPCPDGKRLAFVTREALMSEGRNEFLTRILISDGKTSTPLPAEQDRATTPRWSPDGIRLAFLKRLQGKPQIHVLEADGAVKLLTDFGQGVQQFKWSPDGSEVAFLASDPLSKPKEPYFLLDRAPTTRMYVVSSASGPKPSAPRCLTPGQIKLLSAMDTSSSMEWAPDGKSIACIERIASTYANEACVSIVNLRDASLRRISATGPFADISWDRHSGKIAALKLLRSTESIPMVGADLLVISQDGKQTEALPPTPDRYPRAIIGWTSKGCLLLVEEENLSTVLLEWDPQSRDYRRLDAGEQGTKWHSRRNLALDPTGKWIGYSFERWDAPPEAYRSPVDAWQPILFSSINQFLDLPSMPRTEQITWTSEGGLKVDGILTYPMAWKPGKRFPALIELHGGPIWCYTEIYQGSHFGRNNYGPAALAAEGFAVLQVNFRGSTGRGLAYRSGPNASLNKDVLDVLSAADALVARGIADPERMGIMGWSYGGFLTAKAITKSPRFHAASVGAGAVDSFVQPVASSPAFFGGNQAQAPQAYLDNSPLYHLKEVKTPVLIQHGSEDATVPFWHAEALYQGLTREGCEVRFQVFPGMGHGPTDPKTTLIRMQTNLDWFKSKLQVP